MSLVSITLLLLASLVANISGHGRMLDPPNRSSLWRFNDKAAINWNDDQVNCGGKGIQWEQNGGLCGVCGDQYDLPHPQPNENTGTYGQGIIVNQYAAGSEIDIEIELTANHMGFFNFSLCVLEDLNAPETDDCFQQITLADGSTQYDLPNTEEIHETASTFLKLKLPEGLTCDRCVLRWNYNTGNSWGQCADGTSAIGCGAQETFRECADIAIL